MKIEIGESLCYSYLRHVKQCWLVQTNWKVSEHWERKNNAELETLFQTMKQKFDKDGTVFKQTKNAEQFVKQGEIDVLGIDQEGNIHALDVAFHEAGLNYGGGADNRVLKKILRTYICLNAYHPPETKFHIYFASPKVHNAVQEPLENLFAVLQEEYGDANWHLLTNDNFAQIVSETLEKASEVADTSELFVRSWKLLNLAEDANSSTLSSLRTSSSFSAVRRENYVRTLDTTIVRRPPTSEQRVQPIVQRLMETLLMEVLDEEDINNLMDKNYCKEVLDLKIGNHELLRKEKDGREVKGRSRYWKDLYADEFYVCSEWGKQNHSHNAKSLLKFVCELVQRQSEHQDILNPHIKELTDYVSN